MSAGPRRFTVYCTRWQPRMLRLPRHGCSWKTLRTADRPDQALHGTCPRCGALLTVVKPA